MAGTSGRKDVKSPQEIEEGINSSPTVTWDPFTVFPKEIYVKIFDKLDSPSDKQNFMNAHVQWYELFESKRTLFLFGEVLKELAKRDDQEDRVGRGWKRAFKNYQHSRLVCRDWNRGAQNYFQLHDCYFRIEDEGRSFGGGFVYEPRNSFIWYTAREAEMDLDKFSVTHPPSRNPFFSRRVTLLSVSEARRLRSMALERAYNKFVVAFNQEVGGFVPIEGEINEENWRELAEVEREFEGVEPMQRYRTSVGAILERYGRHLWHCKIEIKEELNPEACLAIAKWLDLMPDLKTLELIHPSMRCLNSQVSHDLYSEIEDMQLDPPELKNLVLLKTTYLPPIVFNKLFGN